ncbi:MAG: restriction endonuclease [Defluviitaleaceae bacterium]|nr:restriction endonuclease [Defluviitaleaceae bacterium]
MANSKINTTHAKFINWIPPFIEVIQEKGGSATPKEVRDGIAEKMGLDDDFLAERHEKSNQLRFDNQVYWAKQYLAWEKLVETSKRGVWSLTDEGRECSLNYEDALSMVRKWIEFHRIARKTRENKDDTDSLTVDAIDIEPEEKKDLSLLEILKQTTPTGFEHLCGRLLREYDFEDIKITQASRDGGIDGTATLKLNPFLSMSVFFQCKRYDGSVPISHVREFMGVLASDQNGADRGIFITTGSLPKAAFDLERKNTKLELIDGEKLVEMFEKAEIGVKPRTVYDPDMAFFAQYMNP